MERNEEQTIKSNIKCHRSATGQRGLNSMFAGSIPVEETNNFNFHIGW